MGGFISEIGTVVDAIDTLQNGGADKKYEDEKTCTDLVERGAADGAINGLSSSLPGAGAGILAGLPVSVRGRS